MRKIYTTLALAAAVCVSASAVDTPRNAAVQKGVAELQQFVSTLNVSTPAKKTVKAKATATIDDFVGFYTCKYEWPWNGDDQAAGKTYANITKVDNENIAITISPYCGGYSNVDMTPVVAKVNPSAGTFSINLSANRNLGTFTESTGTVNRLGWAYVEVVMGNNSVELVPKTGEQVCTLNEDGTITLCGENEICGFSLNAAGESWVGGFQNLSFAAPDYFKYNAAEWTSIGTATYKEWVINPVFKEEYQVKSSECELLHNVNIPSQYLLLNPYAATAWDQLNEGTNKDGFIVMDITENCVAVRPLVPSGMWLDFGEENAPELEQFYIWNQEGSYVFIDGFSGEDVAEVLDDEDIEHGYYDAVTRTAHAVSVYFGETSNPTSSLCWVKDNTNPSKPVLWDQYFDVVMPEGFVLGIKGVNAEAANGVKKYYNLQGVEISAPIKGQVVIVKDGKKAVKQIVK